MPYFSIWKSGNTIQYWKSGKIHLGSDPYPDKSQNLIDRFFSEDLSFHIIWFTSVGNFARYPANKQTNK